MAASSAAVLTSGSTLGADSATVDAGAWLRALLSGVERGGSATGPSMLLAGFSDGLADADRLRGQRGSGENGEGICTDGGAVRVHPNCPST